MTVVGPVDVVRHAVASRGRVEGSLLKVDDFLNHRVEPVLIEAIGAGLAEMLGSPAPDLVLTAEASGIPPALACATLLGVPMVYAKKYLGPGDRHALFREVASPTKGTEYRVEVARHVLDAGLRVAVVDDFLSRGRTAQALGEIAEEAGCSVSGCGFVIEKSFMAGRDLLAKHGWPVHALVRVASLEGGRVEIADWHG